MRPKGATLAILIAALPIATSSYVEAQVPTPSPELTVEATETPVYEETETIEYTSDAEDPLRQWRRDMRMLASLQAQRTKLQTDYQNFQQCRNQAGASTRNCLVALRTAQPCLTSIINTWIGYIDNREPNPLRIVAIDRDLGVAVGETLEDFDVLIAVYRERVTI